MICPPLEFGRDLSIKGKDDAHSFDMFVRMNSDQLKVVK